LRISTEKDRITRIISHPPIHHHHHHHHHHTPVTHTLSLSQHTTTPHTRSIHTHTHTHTHTHPLTHSLCSVTHPNSTNPEHAAAIALEQTHIKQAEAFQQAQLEQVERDQAQTQTQAHAQRWSCMHPLLQGGKLYEYTDDVLIEERNQEMRQLAEETAALDQMMEQVEVEVMEQGEQLDAADVHVQAAHQNVDEGVKTIIASSKSKKYHAITGGGAVVGAGVGVGVGVVLGPAGMVVGGLIGAAVGGAAGFGAGKAIRRKRDMDAFKYHMENKWVRDEDVKGCRGCSKKFTRTRRRHHCRSCGRCPWLVGVLRASGDNYVRVGCFLETGCVLFLFFCFFCMVLVRCLSVRFRVLR
jgi:FYVE zinc finger